MARTLVVQFILPGTGNKNMLYYGFFNFHFQRDPTLKLSSRLECISGTPKGGQHAV